MTQTRRDVSQESAPQSALIVRVPKLDDVISRVRHLSGIPPSVFPAHVTVMAPFPSLCELSENQKKILRSCCERITKFDFVLDKIAWFADEVVYFHILQSEQFFELTNEIAEAFRCSPYEGRHKDFVPHVTIALNDTKEHLHMAARLAEVCLPVVAEAESVVLWEKDPLGPWRGSFEVKLTSLGEKYRQKNQKILK